MRARRLLIATWILVLGTVATAGPMMFTGDPLGDFVGTWRFDVWMIGSTIDNGRLYFEIRTNYPQAGVYASDSYADHMHISPGDVVIAVGASSPFDPAATLHAIPTTDHDNCVPQAYPGETWMSAKRGELYTNVTMADGTYEAYQAKLIGLGIPYAPDDMDGNHFRNSYPTFAKTGTEVLGVAELYYQSSTPPEPWKYEITGSVPLSAIGLGTGMEYAIFWATECGNDGAVHTDTTDALPEPATGTLVLLGLIAARKRRRR